MLIAQDKRKKNIAEYILYMWQMEDTLRALKFDMNLVEEKLVSQFNQPEKIKGDIRDWYANLILAMHEEGLQKKGHLKIVTGVTNELFELHKRLLHEVKDEQYTNTFSFAKPNIESFREKLQLPDANDIEVCFTGLYGLLLLRLKKKDITEQTTGAMQTFSNLLSVLSKHYRDIESGKAEF